MDILLLIVGLGLILAGANFLTDGSAALAQRFRMPEFLVGLTIIAIGTSTPELVISVFSAAAGNSEMAIGNIVGSNLFNVFVILGLCALIRPLTLSAGIIRRDIPFGLTASIMLLVLACDKLLHLGSGNSLGRIDGLIMLAFYFALMAYTIRSARENRPAEAPHATAKPGMALWLMILLIVVGLAGLIGGGELFLRNATAIARRFHISESLIAITLVAGGTSLPELAASVVSLIKGKADMALGNVIGSCVVNILLILGLSATIRPLALGGITVVDLIMVVVSFVLLFATAFSFKRGKLDRYEGAIFLVIYGVYLWYLIK